MMRNKKQVNAILGSVLSFALAFSPAFALAAEMKSKIISKESNALGRAMLLEFARAINSIHNQQDFKDLVVSQLPKKEQMEIAPEVKSIKTLPRAQMQGDVMVLNDAGEIYKIRWENFPEPQFHIFGDNWSIDWRYSSHQSLRFQTELLRKKIAWAKEKKSALHALVLPDAKANAGTIGVAISVLTFLYTIWTPAKCWLIVDVAGSTTLGGSCDAQILAKKTAAVEGKDVKVDALEKSRTEGAVDPLKWDKLPDAKCPSKFDKSKNVFQANVREYQVSEIEIPNPSDPKNPKKEFKISEVAEPFCTRVSYKEDGKPQEGYTANKCRDLDADDAKDRFLTKLIFDKQGNLTQVGVPRIGKDADPKATGPLPIDVAETNLKDPNHAVTRDRMMSLVRQINKWLESCNDEEMSKQVKEFTERATAKTPQIPTNSTTTPSDKPSATTPRSSTVNH